MSTENRVGRLIGRWWVRRKACWGVAIGGLVSVLVLIGLLSFLPVGGTREEAAWMRGRWAAAVPRLAHLAGHHAGLFFLGPERVLAGRLAPLKESCRGNAFVRRKSQLQHRQPAVGRTVRRVRTGQERAGDHGSRHGPEQRLRLCRNGRWESGPGRHRWVEREGDRRPRADGQ